MSVEISHSNEKLAAWVEYIVKHMLNETTPVPTAKKILLEAASRLRDVDKLQQELEEVKLRRSETVAMCELLTEELEELKKRE